MKSIFALEKFGPEVMNSAWLWRPFAAIVNENSAKGMNGNLKNASEST